MVVVFIISISLALIMPSLWVSSDMSALRTEARHMGSSLRYVYDEAVGRKQTYLLNINLDDRSWGFESSGIARSFKIKGDIEINDVMIPSHGKISRGEITVVFGPLGPEEPIILHLRKGDSEYTVIFNHLNGRVKIHEGYVL